jgi:biotin operon repressor
MFRCNHVCKKVIGFGDINWVLRGQFISSNYKLAEAWGWSESSVRKFMRWLQDNGMIVRKASVKWTLYEVTKYCVYQGIDTSELQQISNARKTHKKRTTNAQRTPNNNDNNYNKLKEIINIYTSDPKLNESLNNFLEMRIQKKKMPTENALNLITKKLSKFDISVQIEMVNKSVVNGWTDVYELKPNQTNTYQKQDKSNRTNFEQREYDDNYFKGW